MWVFDKKTLEFLAVNRAAAQQYGFSEDEFLGMSILDIRPVQDVPRLLQETMCPHEHNPEPEVWRHRTKEGRAFPVQITAYLIRFADHEAELVVARELKATVNEFADRRERAQIE